MDDVGRGHQDRGRAELVEALATLDRPVQPADSRGPAGMHDASVTDLARGSLCDGPLPSFLLLCDQRLGRIDGEHPGGMIRLEYVEPSSVEDGALAGGGRRGQTDVGFRVQTPERLGLVQVDSRREVAAKKAHRPASHGDTLPGLVAWLATLFGQSGDQEPSLADELVERSPTSRSAISLPHRDLVMCEHGVVHVASPLGSPWPCKRSNKLLQSRFGASIDV